MQKIMLTCPFTGIEFEGMKDSSGNILIINPLTGDHVKLDRWLNRENKTVYKIPYEAFTHIDTISQTEAAEIIGVSKPRISALCQSGQLKSVTVGNSVIISKDSAIEYRDSERKAGRRW